MELITRSLFVIVTTMILFVVAYGILRGISSINQGYSWEEMDWNQDGTTTISEFIAAGDIGRRDFTWKGRKCAEYFTYKDGLPVKRVCYW